MINADNGYDKFISLFCSGNTDEVNYLYLECNDYRLHYIKAKYYNKIYYNTESEDSYELMRTEIKSCVICLDSVIDNRLLYYNVENGRAIFLITDGCVIPYRYDIPISEAYCFAAEFYAFDGKQDLSLEMYKKYHLSNGIASDKVGHLFSFRPFSEYCLKDLVNKEITLCHPSTFNDPVDSLVLPWIKNLPNICNSSSHIRPQQESYKYYRVRSFCRDMSKSKAVQNTLMWAHYAKDHTGICIEYEFSPDFVKDHRLMYFKDVVYTKKTQRVDLSKEKTLSSEIALYTKNGYWRYENETRLISYIVDSDSPYLSIPFNDKARVVAVYFGIKCDQARVDIIKHVLADKDVEFYQMLIDLKDVHKLQYKKIL